jgi:hypothetical protein
MTLQTSPERVILGGFSRRPLLYFGISIAKRSLVTNEISLTTEELVQH